MIKSGRRTSPNQKYIPEQNLRKARLTALVGALVFTVFLCSSVTNDPDAQMADSAFGEGAYQVFSTMDESADEKDASAVGDDSVWAYLESAIARLIYGER